MEHFYIIYKIVNTVNGKFYIGMHKTTDINDDYYGSGINIRAAIKKYKIENFKKYILHVFAKRKDAIKKEKELVTEELIKNPMCYNLTVGGNGGFHHIREHGKHKLCQNRKVIHNKLMNKTAKVSVDMLQKYLEEGWELGFSPESLQKMSNSGKKRIQSEEHRRKNSEAKKNSRILENTQTGQRKFIKNHLVDEYLKNGWVIFDSGKTSRGKVFIFNPSLKICTKINPKDLNTYVDKGWIKGPNPQAAEKRRKTMKRQ